jgi:hypothetical protein
METQTTTQKKELIDWISTIDDVEVLKELTNIKKHATFNFDEEFKKGISSEEARQLSKDKIREWWGK